MEEPTTQQALQKSKQDSASLYVLRDIESSRTKPISVLSGISSKLSLVFDFDQELFATKVCNVVHRASVVEAIRRNPRAKARQTLQSAQHSFNTALRNQRQGQFLTITISGPTREELFLKAVLNPASVISPQISLWRRDIIRRIIAHDISAYIEDWLEEGLFKKDRNIHNAALTHLRRVVDGYAELYEVESKDLASLWNFDHLSPLLAHRLHSIKRFAETHYLRQLAFS